MSKHCTFCNVDYPQDSTSCLECGRPAPPKGYPNCNLASEASEKDQLHIMYLDAKAKADHNSCTAVFADFEHRVQNESMLVTACKYYKFFPRWE